MEGLMRLKKSAAVGTATADKVLEGETFSNITGTGIIGTMKKNDSINDVLNTDHTLYEIPKGYHDGTGIVQIYTQSKSASLSIFPQTIKPDEGKVLSYVSVPAITGTADASNVLIGKTFCSASGISLNGTMGNYEAQLVNTNSVLTSGGYVTMSIPYAGYYSMDSKIRCSVTNKNLPCNVLETCKVTTGTAGNGNIITFTSDAKLAVFVLLGTDIWSGSAMTLSVTLSDDASAGTISGRVTASGDSTSMGQANVYIFENVPKGTTATVKISGGSYVPAGNAYFNIYYV